jgi:kynureninase
MMVQIFHTLDIEKFYLFRIIESLGNDESVPSIYLCGNSLGLQPVTTREYVNRHLDNWASKGVYGHFTEVDGVPTKPWLDIDEDPTTSMATLVGAKTHEVAIMQTLTANLHLLLLSFYKPTKDKYKIIIESKAFPSDHFVVQSQLAHHGRTAKEALILIEPSHPDTHYFSAQHVLDTIDKHAESTALILLPGIQFYTGQLFDIKRITSHAHSKGIPIGWDLAHAAGNVPLQLHEWQVDFAVWCTYKYLNSGPGAMGALFVHENNSSVRNPPSKDGQEGNDQLTGGLEAEQRFGYTHRLAGWWGSSKDSRFDMNNVFIPISGARGWQLSNPSVLDMSSVIASLRIFDKTDMQTLRKRSIRLTNYLEYLLLNWSCSGERPYQLLTPRNPSERGAQLSIKLNPGLLDPMLEHLEHKGVVIDERKPDVIRIAPAPLYNTFSDVWNFVDILWQGFT